MGMMESGLFESERDLLTVEDLMKIFNISRSFAYKLCKDPSFPIVKIGSLIRIKKTELEAWIKNQKNMSR